MDCSPTWQRPFARDRDRWQRFRSRVAGEGVRDLRFFPVSVEGGWPLRVRGMLKHVFYLELGDAWG